MSFNYPLLLELTGRRILIVGGGAVAARKARGLIDAGADRICCVAPEFCGEMPAEGVERIADQYRPEHMEGAALVFAATNDPAVNAAIVRDARQRNILVNRADSNSAITAAAPEEADPGDFATPALLRDGELLITVSAGGNPALAAALRDAIGKAIGTRWGRMVAAMQEIRPRILASHWPIEKRRSAFRDLATPAALDVLEFGGADALWQWLAERHGQL